MINRYFYLVCKKSWTGRLTPIKICTALAEAKTLVESNKKYVIYWQTQANKELEPLPEERM